jgi:hypothetical protein
MPVPSVKQTPTRRPFHFSAAEWNPGILFNQGQGPGNGGKPVLPPGRQPEVADDVMERILCLR